MADVDLEDFYRCGACGAELLCGCGETVRGHGTPMDVGHSAVAMECFDCYVEAENEKKRLWASYHLESPEELEQIKAGFRKPVPPRKGVWR